MKLLRSLKTKVVKSTKTVIVKGYTKRCKNCHQKQKWRSKNVVLEYVQEDKENWQGFS